MSDSNKPDTSYPSEMDSFLANLEASGLEIEIKKNIQNPIFTYTETHVGEDAEQQKRFQKFAKDWSALSVGPVKSIKPVVVAIASLSAKEKRLSKRKLKKVLLGKGRVVFQGCYPVSTKMEDISGKTIMNLIFEYIRKEENSASNKP